MRKRLSYLLVVAVFVSMLSLSGCGGGGGTTKSEANPYEGKWVAVVAEAMGVQLPIEECFEGDLSFELNSGGKVVFHADEETGNGKWAVADNKLTITIQGEEMVADVGENTFTFDDLMDMGLKVIFGKEGTDATNPENYLTEDELALIGDWHSETVEELLGDGPQTTMDGVDNINDALRLTFAKDYTVKVVYKGQEMGTFKWSLVYGLCNVESENPSVYVATNEYGSLNVDYSDDEDFLTFKCVKDDAK